MARWVRFLVAVDVSPRRGVVIAYPSGWLGLIPNAQFDRLRAGTFVEVADGIERARENTEAIEGDSAEGSQ